MAELTELDEKVAEVYGLAQAAQNATEKVSKLVDDEQIVGVLQQMHEEAAETEQRCEQLAGELDGKKTAIQDKARETKQEAEQMMKDYLGDDADGLDGLEFLIMAEAGELGHVEIVGAMNEQVGEQRIQELFEWAKPIQQRHFEQTRECALSLARQEA
ncbi:MAG TPA: hypothetical protein VJT68_09480 [Thermoleophilaceae bacterium]|nr:hypothetical protein [Thermoleophilaceae bacterium]